MPAQDGQGQSASNAPEASPELRAQVERVLALIRPAVREDGGDIELVSVSADGLVQIRFQGACVGCPSAPMTLHHGIERALRAELDGVTRVEAVR